MVQLGRFVPLHLLEFTNSMMGMSISFREEIKQWNVLAELEKDILKFLLSTGLNMLNKKNFSIYGFRNNDNKQSDRISYKSN